MRSKTPYFHKFGSLMVIGSFSVNKARKWITLCDCGRYSVHYASNIRSGLTSSCGDWSKHPKPSLKFRKKKEIVAYCTVHQRIKNFAGPARDYDCRDCEGPAAEWSFMGCTEALMGRDGLYCHHMRHYTPRCRSCHKKHDSKVKGETRK